jgi:hypothetical protein
MMRNGSPQDRVPYLSIGVFAQKMVDGLIGFVETGKRENLESYLGEALASLKASTGEEEAHAGRAGMRALPSYEQMRTFNEVIATPERRDKIIEALDGLLKQRGSVKQQRKNAETAIRFFYDLETRALRNFDQPDEPLPRGIRELCKAV